MKKKILILVACLVAVAGVLCGIYLPESDINNSISEIQNTVLEEIENIEAEESNKKVVVTEQTEELVIQTKETIESGDDLSTTELIESSEEEEQTLEEEYLELDGVVEQENISYDGDNTESGISLLGAYQGLTYYSQADSRWANVLYTSTGNSSQTIKSSGCGPTSAAIVVSSSKGAILPTTMAQLAVDNRLSYN